MAIPYKESAKGKKEQVSHMFNAIARRYDFLNHFLSLGIDRYWRRTAINYLKAISPRQMLDVATGTADFAIAAQRLKPELVRGIDISKEMLNYGQQKIEKRGLSQKICIELGDSESLRFPDNSFDAITVGFGVRNFENLEKGLSEMLRVLRPGGMVVILEFSKPRGFILARLFMFYFKHILPAIGKFFSKDNSAYTYLPESVQEFPCGDAFADILKKVGYARTKYKPLTFGISTVYVAVKPS